MKNIYLLLGLLLISGCSNKEQTEQNTHAESETLLKLSDKQLASFELSTTELQEKSIIQTIRLNGVIELPPQNLVSVSVAMGGYLKSTKLMPGMYFKKGEVLAVLEDHQYIQLQQDYLTAKAQLQNATFEYQRQKELNLSKASSDKVYQQAMSDYQSLLLLKEALEEKLRLLHINPNSLSPGKISRTITIYAPFEGYVTAVNANIGKYVSPAEVLFELVNPKDMHLNIKVFEKDWGKIKTEQPIIAYSNTNPTEKYSGKVVLVGKAITSERTLVTYSVFDTYHPELLPGMYMNAEIEVPDDHSQALPEDCVQTFEGANYVFIALDNNTFEMIAVEAGNTGNGWTSINSPEKLKNKKIVQQGAYTLLMALKNKGEED